MSSGTARISVDAAGEYTGACTIGVYGYIDTTMLNIDISYAID
jgi:hypothetical protein